jgi:hypothetical protein
VEDLEDFGDSAHENPESKTAKAYFPETCITEMGPTLFPNRKIDVERTHPHQDAPTSTFESRFGKPGSAPRKAKQVQQPLHEAKAIKMEERHDFSVRERKWWKKKWWICKTSRE